MEERPVDYIRKQSELWTPQSNWRESTRKLSPPFKMRMQKTLGTLFFMVAMTNACFITNCPPGGKKRSGPDFALAHHTGPKECTACGPSGLGRCFSPSLCCGPLIGCYHGTAESEICREENESPIVCVNQAPRCTSVARGQCAFNDVCCNDHGECAPDVECMSEEYVGDNVLGRLLSRPSNMAALKRRMDKH